MSGMAGIVCIEKNSRNSELLHRMLHCLRHAGQEAAGVSIDGHIQRKTRLDDLEFKTRCSHTALGHVGLCAGTQTPRPQPFRSPDRKLVLFTSGALQTGAMLRTCGAECSPGPDTPNGEFFLWLVRRNYHGNLFEALRPVLPLLEGHYALAVSDNRKTVIACDTDGRQLLHYCRMDCCTAFATKKNALAAISAPGVTLHRLDPGHVAVLDGTDINEIPFLPSRPGFVRQQASGMGIQ